MKSTSVPLFSGFIFAPVARFFRRIRCNLRLAWHRAWIRKDEFHRSLDFDIEAYVEMSKPEQKAYIVDLVRRRQIAHNRDLER